MSWSSRSARSAALVVRVYTLVFVAVFACSALAQNAPPDGEPPDYVAGELLIKLRDGAADEDRDQLKLQVKARSIRAFRMGAEQWVLPSGLSVEDAIAELEGHALVEYVEPNYLLRLDYAPNDPRYPELWGLHNTGQTGGTPGADIDAEGAWNVLTDAGSALIGIIDTGIDRNHPDLAENIWVNPGEVADNGIDDDGNGYVDDVYGWDFVNNDNDPWDDNGHGTHVAGTIGGVGDNGVGVTGVCWKVQLVGLKFLDAGGYGSTSNAIRAVEYATAIGAHATNNSWGGGSYSQALLDAIEAAGDADQLFVASAGNNSRDNDLYPHYPSSYSAENVIAVAATDHNDQKAGFSCWGQTSVDIAAPGVDTLSTLPGGGYGTKSGTSMAAPHVTGVVALLRASAPGMSALEIKNRILDVADPIPAMAGLTVTGARLNAFLTVADPDKTSPAAISDLAIETPTSNTMILTWTATGDDGADGRAAFYDVRYSTEDLTEENFDDAAEARDVPRPQDAGETELVEVFELETETEYYFAVKALDEWGNPSAISNVASGQTLSPPTVSTSPDSFHAELETGEKTTQTLSVENAGEGTLDWLVPRPTLSGDGGDAQSESMDLAKEEPDPREGPPVLEGRGGPDAHGYRFIDSDEDDGPLYQWRDISADGTVIPISGDDRTSEPIDLGFAFPFYDEVFETVRVSTNGFLSFTNASAPYTNQPIPGVGPENLVAPFWDDLTFDYGQLASYLREPDRFTVQYTNVPRLGSGGSFTFQVTLYASGEIVFRYDHMAGVLDSATIGIQDATKTAGLQVAFNTSYVHDDLAVRVYRIPQWITADPAAGRAWSGETDDVALNFNASGLNAGTYDATVVVESNDPESPSVSHPVTLDVTAAPDISVSTDALDFGTLFTGATTQKTLIVSNDGWAQLSVSDVSADAEEFTADPRSFGVDPHAFLDLSVAFAPVQAGAHESVLTIASDDPDESEVKVNLSGLALDPPDISVSPDALFADLLTGETKTDKITISNDGLSDLEWQIVIRRRPEELDFDSNEGDEAPAEEDGLRTDVPPGDFVATDSEPQTAQDASILLIEDVLPWDSTATRRILEENELEYDLINSATLPSTDLARYDLVIVSSDQYTSTYETLEAAGDQIDDFVESGGVLQYHSAGWGWNGGNASIFTLPRGVRTSYRGSSTDRVIQRDHPIVEGLPEFIHGNSASHSFFTDIPIDSELIIENGNGQPNLIVYRHGSGTVVASGQTLEFGYDRQLDYADLLPNMILFAYDLAPGWLSSDPVMGVLAPGEEIDVDVLFDATDLFGGDYAADLVVVSNDPDEPEVTVAADMHVTGVPEIDLVIPPIRVDSNAGYTSSGATTYHQLELPLTPTGGGQLLVGVDGDFGDYSEFADVVADGHWLGTVGSAHGDCSETSEEFPLSEELLAEIAADGVVEVEVRNSSSVGTFCDVNEHRVTLAYEPPEGSGLDFGDVYVGYSGELTVEIHNTGTDDLIVSTIASDNDAFVPSISSATVPPRSMTPVIVTFAPPEAEAFEGTLTIESNDSDEPQLTVPMSGVGLIPPVLTVAPDSLRADLFTGETLTLPLSLGNDGGSELIWSLAIEGDAGAAPPPWLGAIPSEGTLDPGGSVEISVDFDASGMDSGEYPASLVINSNDPARREVVIPVLLHVIGVPDIEVLWNLFQGESTQAFRNSGAETSHTISAGMTPTGGGELFVEVFGDYGTYSEYANVYLENEYLGRVGNAPYDCTSASDTFDLTAEQMQRVIEDGIVRVEVRNSYNVDDFCGVNEHRVVLRYPSHREALDWGEVYIGFPESQQFTIKNTGTDTLDLHTISSDEPAFVPDATSMQIPRGSEATLSISLDPPEARLFEATLSLHSNDPDEPLITIPLRGTGLIPPDIALIPTEIDESLFTGGASVRTMEIENSGGSDLDWTITVDGGGPPWLGFTGESGVTGAEQSAVLSLAFDAFGLSGGDYEATLRVESNDPDEGSLVLPIVLHVTDAPDIDLDPIPVVRDSVLPYGASDSSSHHKLSIDPPPVAGGRVIVTAEGDFGGYFEKASVLAEGTGLPEVGAAPHDCMNTLPSSIDLSASAVSELLSDGILEIDVNNSASVDLSCQLSRHHVEFRYDAGSDRVDLGAVLVGDARETTLTIHNRGTLPLHLTEASFDDEVFEADPTQFVVAPGANNHISLRFAPTSAGPREAHLALTSDDPYEGALEVTLLGEGRDAPEIEVGSGPIEETVLEGDIRTRAFEISNGGGSELYFIFDRMSPSEASVAEKSPAFGPDTDEPPDSDTDDGGEDVPPPPPEDELYRSEVPEDGPQGPGAEASSEPSIAEVLERLDASHQSILDELPDAFPFSEGVTGYNITYGNRIFNRGNILRTSRTVRWLYYSDGVPRTVTGLGGGTYFTRKYTGLFVFAGDLLDVDSFLIAGRLEPHQSHVDGSVLEMQFEDKTYRAFVKRVYGGTWPSVNHLIIVENQPSAYHEFSTRTYSDYHRVNGLHGRARVFYLLFTSRAGLYVDDAKMLSIMRAFIETVPRVWVSSKPSASTLAAGESSQASVTLDASSLLKGTYSAELLVGSTDPQTPAVVLPVELDVVRIIADAGPDQVVECTSDYQAVATLDGRRSRHADGFEAISRWEWTEGDDVIGNEALVDVSFPMGGHDVGLWIGDDEGEESTDAMRATIVDTLAPVGRIDYPETGQCLGPSAAPLVVTDDYRDACTGEDLTRDYSLPEGATYTEHGDYELSLTVSDPHGNVAPTTDVDFTLDLIAPEVAIIFNPSRWPFLFIPGFDELFEAGDDDDAMGDIVHEVIRLDDCVLYDGKDFGDADGLLRDEHPGQDPLCRAVAVCGTREWHDPVLEISVTDCGGNKSQASRVFPGGQYVPEMRCP